MFRARRPDRRAPEAAATCTSAREVAAQLGAARSPASPGRARLDAQNRNWFAAVQIEKRMMFIILTLIIAVAAFNLVSRW